MRGKISLKRLQGQALTVFITAVVVLIVSKTGWQNSLPASFIVTRVIDGDTIVLNNGARVRYIGIDTPELSDHRRSVRTLAFSAKEYNQRLVEGKTVRLEYDLERFDKYHRILAYVYIGDLFVNAELVKEGYATLLTIPPNVKYTSRFLALQEQSRENKKGLWRE